MRCSTAAGTGRPSANGGFLLALATRAIGEVLPFPDPVVVSGFYLRPGSPGPAEIRTEVIRAGLTTGFGQASLCRDGKEVLRATAAYTDLDAAAARGGPSYTGGEPPAQPPPEQCQVLSRVIVPPITLVERIEYRCRRAALLGDAHAAVGQSRVRGLDAVRRRPRAGHASRCRCSWTRWPPLSWKSACGG